MSWPAGQRAVEAAQQEHVEEPFRRRLRRRFAPVFPPGAYVLAYHAIAGEQPAQWERAYSRVVTTLANFRSGLARLVRRLEPARLEDLPKLLEGAGPREPRLVVTFDDGYADLLGAPVEVCDELGIEPTVFVSAEFAGGRSPYYRVVVALLEQEGRAEKAAELLNERLDTDAFTAANLAARTKEWPDPEALVEPIFEAWGQPLPRAHLTYDELKQLASSGWTIGNHTRTHRPLVHVAAAGLDAEILGNERELRHAGLQPLPWLAYPNGRARDVGQAVGEWLDRHPEYHGVFAAGGVNVGVTRTEWRRIPVLDEDPAALERLLLRAGEVAWPRSR